METVDVPLGARIPRALKKKLAQYCHAHGLKMSHVVRTALEDKLGELEEEIEDRRLGRERLEDAEFVTREEFARYLKRRRAKR